MDIATSEFGSLDTLTSKDLKLAIGEEVEEDEELDEEVKEKKPADLEEELVDNTEETENTTDNSSIDGVDALKNLLAALNDKNVAASMKGMKISINITLGEN